MANAKVSSNFSKFMAKNAKAVEEAKKAENSMQTCAMPIGWKGQAVCVDATADKGKDKKDDKGNTREGNEYVRLEFQVINDEQYGGKKFSKFWSFYDSANATAADRFEWFLNDLENMGLPREIRESFTDPAQLLNHFTQSDEVYDCEVEHSGFSRDRKNVRVSQTAEAVDNSGSAMAPVEEPSPETLTPGQTVRYLNKDWELVDKDGDELSIKSKTTGSVRQIKVSDLE